MTEVRAAFLHGQPGAFLDFFPDTLRQSALLRKNGAARIGFRLKTEHPPDVGALGIGQIPANHFRNVVHIVLGDGKTERVLQLKTGFRPDIARQLGERFAHGMEVGLALHAPDGIAVPAGLRGVDMHRNLAEAAFHDEALEKLGLLNQGLAVRHQHRDKTDLIGITNDFDQFIGATGAPVGIGHVASCDLEAAAGALKPAVGIDLLFHFGQGRNGNLVRVLGQITMRAVKRTVTGAENETAVRQMSARDLVRRL